MLKLVNLTKDYKTPDNIVNALKGVNICFRQNEFVSVLGPSGCGKTTMLNIIGGLDHSTSGDLVIYGKSTKEYEDRDWDVYRNHRIGFVFQSYNLIPHQTVLGNVELALTIAGMSKVERVEKAKAALDKVGLSDQYNKRPNQLSGGQCQRVAIARALVNDPEILLADEPTGALDTKTSEQIMDLVKEIAKERLVIMVTHNSELAEEYSTRIIKLRDGELVSDTNPFSEKDEAKATQAKLKAQAEEEAKALALAKEQGKKIKPQKAKMSFFTAFKLSLQNLFTKKKRTVMTAIASSIGIIGVSLVLSISIGLQGFINNMQNDMLSGNPITISQTSFDINAMMSNMTTSEKIATLQKGNYVNVESMMQNLADRAESMENMMIQNTITQDYVEFIKEIPQKYMSATMLNYGLDVSNNIYTDFYVDESAAEQTYSLSGIRAVYTSILDEIEKFADYATLINALDASFSQAPDARNATAEEYILSQYNVLKKADGTNGIAKEKNEVMIVLNNDRAISDLTLAQLGYYTQEEFVNLVRIAAGEIPKNQMYEDSMKIEYDRLIGKTFTYYNNDDIYDMTGSSGMYFNMTSGVAHMNAGSITYNAMDPFAINPSAQGLEFEVVGVLEPKAELSYGMLDNGFYYTPAFAEYVVEQNWNSAITTALQNADEDSYSSMAIYTPAGYSTVSCNVPGCTFCDDYLTANPGISHPLITYTGITFEYEYTSPSNTLAGPRTAYGLVGNSGTLSAMVSLFMGSYNSSTNQVSILSSAGLSLQQLGGNIVVEKVRDTDGKLLSWSETLVDGEVYPLPSQIAIYPKDFKLKQQVLNYLDRWNSNEIFEVNGKLLTPDDREEIKYSDLLSLIIGMIQSLLQIITIALIGFTSLALIVSCVMIGIITYVSVVERIKEIGVIRSLGGRKRDVSNLFVAETGIIGFVSGIIGILVTYLLSGLINLIVGSFDIAAIASFPIWVALIMLGISIGLTLIAGVMPSMAAAKKDPVVALRTE